jgi:hypothetical protein
MRRIFSASCARHVHLAESDGARAAHVRRSDYWLASARAGTYPWIVKSTAMVNHYYIYAVDRDFGPFFLKFCSSFPYNAKLCSLWYCLMRVFL